MTMSIVVVVISIIAILISIFTAAMCINAFNEIIEILESHELSCDTCKWHGNKCENSEPYEGKNGYVVGDDWCEFYVRKEEGNE